MTWRSRLRTRTTALTAASALTLGALSLAAALPAEATGTAQAAGSGAADPARPGGTLGDQVPGLSDLDLRGRAVPSVLQRRAAAALGAVDLRWNAFGTPSSILPADGVLARATSSDPVEAARTWLRGHAAVFGLTPGAVDALDLVNEQELAAGGGHAVLFRQRFGGLVPALGSSVTVGVARGVIAYVSSSIAPTTATPPAARLSPVDGWLRAAANVGRELDAGAVRDVAARATAGWTRLQVPGYAQPQLVRLRALPMADGSVRPVLQANVVDAAGGSAFAYTVLVDAVDGTVLHRQNQVDNSSDAFPFTGSYTATQCGPKHEFELTDNKTKSITAVGNAVILADDIVVKLFDPAGQLLASGDLGTSPEAVTYGADSIPQGIYKVQLCPFADSTVPVTVGGPYTIVVATSDVAAPGPGELGFNPRWRYFTANPALNFDPKRTVNNSVVGCWVQESGCTSPTSSFENVAAPGPWDTIPGTGIPTMTTIGNNANTHEAWVDPLAPGGLLQAPVSPTRRYTEQFTDAWNNSRCNPANLVPGGNDINQVVGNLFVAHNRMHDYAYYLGFTEKNYNLQLDNLGRGGVAGDQEIGNAQAGAITGGQPLELGRDNANQITLQDGVPGITNQYLFQPLAGAFYSPCTDGGFDMSIVGHEYTHAISNRMIGGPDDGITSEQGGAMGESWGDLVAGEYMFSHGYSNGANPWAVGPYATGNRSAGIRDYPINKNPLNYSDYGFDSTGVEVHADGEIWNGTQWEVRQALVKKWNAAYPYRNKSLQRRCAEAAAGHSPLAPGKCPGNRRWVQLMFDAFLLQQGATSMLDARDAMLAADRMRFGGKDLKVLWGAFAKRGMGKGASTPNADSGDPKPSFVSPKAPRATVSFTTPGKGKIFVGDYEARVTPVADTLPKSKRDNRADFAPGTYRMLYASHTHGFSRFTMRITHGGATRIVVPGGRNLAAKAAGAKVIRATPGSRSPNRLIDGTEDTNWGGVTAKNVDASHPSVAVDLAGGVHRIHRVQVSAMLNPHGQGDGDPDSGSRFTALRRFALDACVSGCSSAKAHWKRFFVSGKNAFPALRPRPVAPNLNLRSFKVPTTRAAAVRLVVLENQCTGYAGYAGEQDSDPFNATDCKSASDRGTIVHVAELQVF
jgi:hypothetical protein